jgi:hypothetical protein
MSSQKKYRFAKKMYTHIRRIFCVIMCIHFGTYCIFKLNVQAHPINCQHRVETQTEIKRLTSEQTHK